MAGGAKLEYKLPLRVYPLQFTRAAHTRASMVTEGMEETHQQGSVLRITMPPSIPITNDGRAVIYPFGRGNSPPNRSRQGSEALLARPPVCGQTEQGR